MVEECVKENNESPHRLCTDPGKTDSDKVPPAVGKKTTAGGIVYLSETWYLSTEQIDIIIYYILLLSGD